jgi:hypothetical protein
MTTPSNLADVEALLGERGAVLGWLAKLDAADSAVPAAVRERVRRDYELRLDGVNQQLQGHGDAIAAKLADERAERDAAAASAATAHEALAEAELRHLVGEYDRSRFEAERARHAADIERHERALGAVSERVRKLEDALAQIVAPAQPVMGGAAAEPAPTPVETIASAPADVQVAEAVIEVEETILEGEIDDEIDEQLLAIFDGSAELADLEIELVEEDTPSEAPAPADERGPLSFRPGTGMPVEADRSIPSFGMPAEVPARFTPAAEPKRTPPPTPTPEPVTRGPMFDEDIVATGPAPEPSTVVAGRTLRCAECGAMNKSSEWYCEKCGAELNVG